MLFFVRVGARYRKGGGGQESCTYTTWYKRGGAGGRCFHERENAAQEEAHQPVLELQARAAKTPPATPSPGRPACCLGLGFLHGRALQVACPAHTHTPRPRPSSGDMVLLRRSAI
jgi:hypothetical protein